MLRHSVLEVIGFANVDHLALRIHNPINSFNGVPGAMEGMVSYIGERHVFTPL